MRIVFLGTAAGIPEPHRKQSSVLVEAGGNHYIIDMGTQAAEQLITRGIDISTVKGIFISHMHCDHSNGIFSMLHLLSKHFPGANPEIFLPQPVDEAVSVMKSWLKLNGTEMRPLSFKPVSEGLIFDDGVLKVTAYKTMHNDMSFAFLFEAEGKRMLYTGDLLFGNPQKDFPYDAMNETLDMIICEGAHFHMSEYFPIFDPNLSNIRRICITHYSSHYSSNRLISIIEFMKAKSEIPVFLATDGMEFQL